MMKTPDEIKKGLLYHGNTLCDDDCPYRLLKGFGCRGILCDDALAYIQQLEQERNMLMNTVSKMCGKTPRWISVEERLPDKNGKYLVHAHHWVEGVKPIIRCSLWLNGKWDKYDAYTVDHWMPLPEPPVEV